MQAVLPMGAGGTGIAGGTVSAVRAGSWERTGQMKVAWFFGGNGARRDTAGAPDPAVVGVRHADTCSARSCPSVSAIQCGAFDEHGRHCPTAWCSEHGYIRDGGVFCPEHAGFAADDPRSVMPFAARVASLVAREMEEQLMATLEIAAADTGEQVEREPVHFVFFGVGRTRTWERGWKLSSHLGVSVRITLAVEERDAGAVLARVNSRTVARVLLPDITGEAGSLHVKRADELPNFRSALMQALVAGIRQCRSTQAVVGVTNLEGHVRPLGRSPVFSGDAGSGDNGVPPATPATPATAAEAAPTDL